MELLNYDIRLGTFVKNVDGVLQNLNEPFLKKLTLTMIFLEISKSLGC